MTKLNITDVPVEPRLAPQGRYELRRQHIALALGGIKDTGPWGGGHPFDLELVTLPPGKVNFPLHSHAAQTEHYLIVSGTGVLRSDAGSEERLIGGDHVICHPGEAHQILNDGTEPLTYYVITDHHRADITSYPNTGKRQLKPEYRVISTTEADYYAGEE